MAKAKQKFIKIKVLRLPLCKTMNSITYDREREYNGKITLFYFNIIIPLHHHPGTNLTQY